MSDLGDDVLPARPAVAVVVCRDGRLPAGAEEVVAEAGGAVVVAGPGAEEAAAALSGALEAWWWDPAAQPPGPARALAPAGALARAMAPVVARCPCVVLPASPDGRDLAPHLAAVMGRPLLAGAVAVWAGDDGLVRADLLRVDGRVVVPAEAAGPAVATLLPGSRAPAPRPSGTPLTLHRLIAAPAPVAAGPTEPAPATPEAQVLALIAPDPATMDLADARRVLGGGAGLVPRAADDAQARALFALLTEVAAALGASAGATRVVTDAGWAPHERQIGTTGVAVDPALYVAFGVSGASQHTGGLGSPHHVVSVNTDPSCPMTALADLGIVADAPALLVELAGRLGVDVPADLEPLTGTNG